MKKILILGGGTGGLIVGNKLARELRNEIAKDQVEILILDKSEMAVNKAGFTFVPFGYLTEQDLIRNKKSLVSPRIKFIFGEKGRIKQIDIKNKKVITESNNEFSYDYLVIAMGSYPNFKNIKGLSNKDYNTFYTSYNDAFTLGQNLKFVKKGNIVILVTKMPIPCPGASPKFSILLSDYLQYTRDSNTREQINISIIWPTKSIGPPAYDSIVKKACDQKRIDLIKEYNFLQIDENKREVISTNTNNINIKYDFLITVPQFTIDKALISSGLTNNNDNNNEEVNTEIGKWIPTDKNSLQYYKSPREHYEDVYAIGDNGSPEIPKTGIAAHYQALITAQNIINDIHGNGVVALYRGEAGCPFVESSYTSHSRGLAYIPIWTYDRPPQKFPSTELGWLFYRMYYYLHWDSTIKGLM